MAKVLFFTEDFYPMVGGVSRYGYELVKHLSEDKRIERISIVAFVEEGKRKEKIGEKTAIRRIKIPKSLRISGRFYSCLKSFLILYEMIRHRDYYIVHSLTFGVSPWVALWSTLLSRKSFLTVYGTDVCSVPKSAPRGYRFYRFGLKNLDQIFPFSFSTAKILADYYSLDNQLEVIHPGIDLRLKCSQLTAKERQKLRGQLGICNDDFVILTLTRLVQRKGVDLLIEAIRAIDISRIKLLIVGDGPEKRRLNEMVRQYHLCDRVIFYGHCHPNEVYKFYSAADCFALTSYYIPETRDIEGLGIVFLEAQLFDLPVIGSNSGGIPEAFKDGETGILVREKSIQDIKNAIISLYEDPELREKLSFNAYDFVSTKFNWNLNITKHLRAYGI